MFEYINSTYFVLIIMFGFCIISIFVDFFRLQGNKIYNLISIFSYLFLSFQTMYLVINFFTILVISYYIFFIIIHFILYITPYDYCSHLNMIFQIFPVMLLINVFLLIITGLIFSR